MPMSPEKRRELSRVRFESAELYNRLRGLSFPLVRAAEGVTVHQVLMEMSDREIRVALVDSVVNLVKARRL